MSKYYSYLNTAKKILHQYQGDEPFSSFLKKFFSEQKKYGSGDRKAISHLCYCFFRLGKALRSISIDEQILTGLFLCSNTENELLENLRPVWNQKAALPVKEKIKLLDNHFSFADIFAWAEELSEGIEAKSFAFSHLFQPRLYVRMRPGFEDTVKKKLTDAAIQFEQINQSCLSLPNTTKIDSLLVANKEVVIQDLNSQKVAELFPVRLGRPGGVQVWDCCAGSGGKSILAFDLNPKIILAVSDARASIIQNLKKRFERAGIKNYHSFVADLTINKSQLHHLKPEIIIADVPCTGSGTWSRSPEQLYFFQKEKIKYYSQLQQKILSNVVENLSAGGHLVYSTCSVFKKENEDQVEFLQKEFGLELIKAELLKGYDIKADSLFAALLKKPTA
ncbi:MAG: Fmu (Sun) domain-containing protein [Chitinophagaceae bacterium]